MAKTTEKPKPITLSVSQRAGCARALATADETASKIGESIVFTTMRQIHKFIPRGKVITKDDRSAILNKVSDARNWNGATADVRMSELGKVLDARDTISEAVKAYREENGACSWLDVIALARKLNNNGGDVDAAVNETAETTRTKRGPMASAAIHFKAMLNTKGLSTALKDDLRKLANKYNLKIEKAKK